MKAASRQGLALCRRWNRITGVSSSVSSSFAANNQVISETNKNSSMLSGQPPSSRSLRWMSAQAVSDISEYEDDSIGPVGDLFNCPEVGPELVGKTGSIRRSFGPQSNADAMITCGGEALAAHASFDPDYGRARDWIRSHPVGPAVLSPVLISGLVGALVEAAFPQSIVISSSMQLERPLIVGVDVRAKIEVVAASHSGKPENFDGHSSSELLASMNLANNDKEEESQADRARKSGYQVDINTQVVRVRDDRVMAKGTHSIWIPDFLHM